MGAVVAQSVTEHRQPVFGPEPIGAGQAGFLLGRAIEDANGRNNPVGDARGPKGDPTRTVASDLGPLQDFVSLRTTAGPGSAIAPTQALPNTAGGGTIQDRLGALGI